MPDLMTIGEFSRRSGLSPKVLRSYAEVGLLVPVVVEQASGYRYYDSAQLADAEIVGLLRRLGVPVSDIGRFLAAPSADALDGWEQSLVAEVLGRRQALAEVRCRLGSSLPSMQRSPMNQIRPVHDRGELKDVFELLGRQFPEPIRSDDHRFGDLAERFVVDRSLHGGGHRSGPGRRRRSGLSY